MVKVSGSILFRSRFDVFAESGVGKLAKPKGDWIMMTLFNQNFKTLQVLSRLTWTFHRLRNGCQQCRPRKSLPTEGQYLGGSSPTRGRHSLGRLVSSRQQQSKLYWRPDSCARKKKHYMYPNVHQETIITLLQRIQEYRCGTISTVWSQKFIINANPEESALRFRGLL